MSIMMTIDTAIPAIAELLRTIKVAPRFGDPERVALDAICSAVDETRMFLAAVRNGRASLHSPNRELVSLWRTAALEVRAIDPDLSRRLRLKAEYWSDPQHWTPEQVREAQIRIDDVAAEARRLLAGQHGTAMPITSGPTAEYDVFISHAREDKVAVARPLATQLTERGYAVWYDEHTLQLGDSLRREIDRGLAHSRYGIVVLSKSFFAKNWPQRELDALFAMESSDGRKRILPVWHQITAAEVTTFSPTLADKLSVSTQQGLAEVIQQLVAVIGNTLAPPT